MCQSIGFQTNTDVSGILSHDPATGIEEVPTVDFLPADIVRYRAAQWRGLHAPPPCSSSATSRSSIVSRSNLICSSPSNRAFGTTARPVVEGLPPSTMRNYSHRLIFVPAGRQLFGMETPRLLTRSICLYIDPHAVLADPDLRFAELDLEPRLLFEDAGIWETVLKLKAQIGSANPGDRMYGDALSRLLAHEVMRLQGVEPCLETEPARRIGRVAAETCSGVHGSASCGEHHP